MSIFGDAGRWIKDNIVDPINDAVIDPVVEFFNKVEDTLIAAGNAISGLASAKFGTSGTISGGSGKDLLVGLDFGSVTNFLKLSFKTLFSPEFWKTGQIPSSVSGFANDNSNRLVLDGNG